VSGIRKARVVRALLFLHLLLFFWAVIFWGRGYVSLAHHRHEGVVYELTELFDPGHWSYADTTMFPMEACSLSVTGTVSVLWRGTLEQNLEQISRALQSPALFTNLSWVEGVRRSGNPEPTLVAWGTGEMLCSWFEPAPWDRPGQDRYGRDPFDVSLRIYNFDRLWLVWCEFIRIPPNFHVCGCGLPGWWVGRGAAALTPADVLERLHLYRRGSVSRGYLLAALGMPPRDFAHFINPLAEGEFFWLLPRPSSSWGPYDTPYIFGLLFLAMVTAPYRYLFYLPLALVPSALAWPFAAIYAFFLLGSWVWCAARWRRLGRRALSS